MSNLNHLKFIIFILHLLQYFKDNITYLYLRTGPKKTMLIKITVVNIITIISKISLLNVKKIKVF